MSTPTLCPSTKNELGKGTLPTHVEERLLAEGFVFACMLPTKGFKSMLVCKRPIRDAVNDAESDARTLRVSAGLNV